MRAIAALLALILALLCGALALVVIGQAVGGSRYAEWGSMPVVWVGELAVAAGCAVLAIGALVEVARRFDDSRLGDAVVLLEAGVGFLLLAALAIGGGVLGLQVPTTAGYDVLERGEPMLIIGGVVAGAFGLLVVLIAGIGEAIGSAR